jgi:hypothetical protein
LFYFQAVPGVDIAQDMVAIPNGEHTTPYPTKSLLFNKGQLDIWSERLNKR